MGFDVQSAVWTFFHSAYTICSKEFVIRQLLEEQKIPGQELVLIGDGKVEIALGAQNGTYTLGMATDEVHRRGLQPEKARRLVQAGADALAGDVK